MSNFVIFETLTNSQRKVKLDELIEIWQNKKNKSYLKKKNIEVKYEKYFL